MFHEQARTWARLLIWLPLLALVACHPDDDDDSADDDTGWTDEDSDGFGIDDDCDDNDDTVYPGADDPCDDIDQDCDGIDGQDADADGFSTCQQDCDDANAEVHPLAEEQSNGIDDDCDGLIDEVTYPCDDPEQEVNDTAAEANSVESTDTVCGVVDPAGDMDFFVFEVGAYTRVDFDIDATDQGSELSPKVDVWSPDGISRRTGSVGTVDMVATSFFGEAGTYYVSVADMVETAGSMDHFYTLELTATSPCDWIESEHNGECQYANAVDKGLTSCGHIDADTDKDWLAFQVGPGETWTIDMASFAVGSTLKGQLTLVASDCTTELAHDDPTYPNDPTITYTFNSGGWYYLMLESDFYGTYDNGGYLLTFSQ